MTREVGAETQERRDYN